VAFAGSRPIATAIDTWLARTVDPRLNSFLLAMPAILVALVIIGMRTSKRGTRLGRRLLGGHSENNQPIASTVEADDLTYLDSDEHQLARKPCLTGSAR
jgi:hypothetical protein